MIETLESAASAGPSVIQKSSGEVILELQELEKSYGSVKVLNGLNLHVRAGEVYGFLGRNGAGKSTAIRIVMGITRAKRGRILLFGDVARGNFIEQRQRIGYVAQEQNFYPWMSPRHLASFVGRMYPRWDQHYFDHLINRFDLPNKRKVGTFSGGMKARLALSLALATKPELLLLDEPTAGMDPVARREFIDLVHEQAFNEGAAIFFSTHLIDEIESAANRIGIIEAGRTVYEGDLATLARQVQSYSAPLDAEVGNQPFVTEGVSIPPYRVTHERETQGRRALTLQFSETPGSVVLTDGWRNDPMTLEDVFIAVVSAARDNEQN
jgi:ABC-2 type transport system ATP-binding protein